MHVKRDLDDSGSITIFSWETVEDHENCMKSEDWGKLNEEWNAFLGKDDVSFDFLFIGSDWKSSTA